MEDELSAALPPTERSAVFGTKVIVFTLGSGLGFGLANPNS